MSLKSQSVKFISDMLRYLRWMIMWTIRIALKYFCEPNMSFWHPKSFRNRIDHCSHWRPPTSWTSFSELLRSCSAFPSCPRTSFCRTPLSQTSLPRTFLPWASSSRWSIRVRFMLLAFCNITLQVFVLDKLFNFVF